MVVNLKNFSGKWKEPPLPRSFVKANYMPIDASIETQNYFPVDLNMRRCSDLTYSSKETNG